MMQLFSSWTGSDFLLFYTMLLGFALAASWWIPAHLREPGRGAPPDDLESVAVLAGGRARLADSLLTDLYVHGVLTAGEKGRFVIARERAELNPASKTLVAINAPVTFAEAKKAIAVHSERTSGRLQRTGLLLRSEEYSRLRWLSVAPFAALLMLGLYRERAGSALGEPTGFLVILMVLTLAFAIIRFTWFDPRTQAGIAAVRELRSKNGRLPRAPRAEEAAMAVALFGTGVLVGTPWEPVHAMRKQDGDGGSSGDSGSSDGGSGCGGGCGGCGG